MPPSDVPPPPPATPQTQIVGQQTAPSTAVPHTPGLQPQGVGVAGQTNSLAIISLVAGVGSFFAHIIPGVMGMATAGMIIGIVHLVLIALGVIALILIVVFGVGIAFLGIAARH